MDLREAGDSFRRECECLLDDEGRFELDGFGGFSLFLLFLRLTLLLVVASLVVGDTTTGVGEGAGNPSSVIKTGCFGF